MSGGYKYVGVDPESRTHQCLLRLAKKSSDLYKMDMPSINKIGSEDFCPPELQGLVDVAFSSPPYFDVEKYSKEETQSIIKFPHIDDWLNIFMRKTIENCRNMLKPGGYFGINIEDNAKCQIVSKILDLVKSLGLEPFEVLQMPIVQRRGNTHNSTEVFRYVGIYVFRKPGGASKIDVKRISIGAPNDEC